MNEFLHEYIFLVAASSNKQALPMDSSLAKLSTGMFFGSYIQF